MEQNVTDSEMPTDLKGRDYNPECQVDGMRTNQERCDKAGLMWDSKPRQKVSWLTEVQQIWETTEQ